MRDRRGARLHRKLIPFPRQAAPWHALGDSAVENSRSFKHPTPHPLTNGRLFSLGSRVCTSILTLQFWHHTNYHSILVTYPPHAVTSPSLTNLGPVARLDCYLSSFFFPLSARGPTRRRNSTGLAELWGGWPIELGRGEDLARHYVGVVKGGGILMRAPLKTVYQYLPLRRSR